MAALSEDERFETAIWVVRQAMKQAHKAHGPLTADVVRASLILTEEVGEVAKDALGLTRPTPNSSRTMLRDELAQVAGTAIFMIMNLE